MRFEQKPTACPQKRPFSEMILLVLHSLSLSFSFLDPFLCGIRAGRCFCSRSCTSTPSWIVLVSPESPSQEENPSAAAESPQKILSPGSLNHFCSAQIILQSSSAPVWPRPCAGSRYRVESDIQIFRLLMFPSEAAGLHLDR